MPTNTQTLTVERVSNGWLVRTGSGVHVATTSAEVIALCQRWTEATVTTPRPMTALDRAATGWMGA